MNKQINRQKLKLKIITTFLFAQFAIGGLAHAQTYAIPQEKRDQYMTLEDHFNNVSKSRSSSAKLFGGAEEVVIVEGNKEKTPYYSDHQIIRMDELLLKENYVQFFEYFSSINVESTAPLKYLNMKMDEGHIPLFWLMANEYAIIKESFNTHKWLYVALIMTTQDSQICLDRTAQSAPKTLLREFPSILNITTRTPQDIQPAVTEAARFIRNLKKRTNPQWTCSYGSEAIKEGRTTTYYPESWKEIRDSVISRFLEPYNLK